MGITRKTLFSHETGERSLNVFFLASSNDYDFDADYILKGKHGSLQPDLVQKTRLAAESAFQIVNSTDIAVTPAQFAQMLIPLVDTRKPVVPQDENSKKIAVNEVYLQQFFIDFPAFGSSGINSIITS